MSGLKINDLSRAEVVAAVQAIPPARDFVWDGRDQDECPLSATEMREGMARAKKRGRPAGSEKVSTTIRLDADVLAALRATGAGWQTRVNKILRERFAL